MIHNLEFWIELADGTTVRGINRLRQNKDSMADLDVFLENIHVSKKYTYLHDRYVNAGKPQRRDKNLVAIFDGVTLDLPTFDVGTRMPDAIKIIAQKLEIEKYYIPLSMYFYSIVADSFKQVSSSQELFDKLSVCTKCNLETTTGKCNCGLENKEHRLVQMIGSDNYHVRLWILKGYYSQFKRFLNDIF